MLCARAELWGSCECGSGCDCAGVSQGKEGAVSRPRPTERVGERIEKIERAASKGTHAEQKTTWWGAMRQWRGTQQTNALTTKLKAARQGEAGAQSFCNEETTAHILKLEAAMPSSRSRLPGSLHAS